MPLSEAHSNCLGKIRGDDGVVKATSFELGGIRGPFVQNPHVNVHYDTLSRVFFKGSGIQPRYVSLTEINDMMYISYPHADRGMDCDHVEVLKQKIIEYNDTDQAKIAIFKEMYRYGNHILALVLKYMHAWLNKEYRTALDQSILAKQQFFKQMKDAAYKENKTDFEQNLADNVYFENFVLEGDYLNRFGTYLDYNRNTRRMFPDLQNADNLFDYILPNIREVKSLLGNKEILVAGEGDHPRGVHVDVKGVHYAMSKNIEYTELHMGLSHTWLIKPGCCVGCDAEFSAYKKIYSDFNFHHTGSYSRQFAQKNYQPSKLVVEDNNVFLEFATVIKEKVTTSVREKYTEGNGNADEQAIQTFMTKDAVKNFFDSYEEMMWANITDEFAILLGVD